MSKELDGRIALVLGWRSIKPALSRADSLTGLPPEGIRTFVPRWSSSLDLMWELESKLDDEQYRQYIDEIEGRQAYLCGEYAGKWVIAHATAKQKAEAWLKVKEGK